MQGTQNVLCFIEQFSTTEKVSMVALMKEMKPVVVVKFDFESREKLKFKFFPQNFRTIRIVIQQRKILSYQLKTRLQVPFYQSNF